MQSREREEGVYICIAEELLLHTTGILPTTTLPPTTYHRSFSFHPPPASVRINFPVPKPEAKVPNLAPTPHTNQENAPSPETPEVHLSFGPCLSNSISLRHETWPPDPFKIAKAPRFPSDAEHSNFPRVRVVIT